MRLQIAQKHTQNTSKQTNKNNNKKQAKLATSDENVLTDKIKHRFFSTVFFVFVLGGEWGRGVGGEKDSF